MNFTLIPSFPLAFFFSYGHLNKKLHFLDSLENHFDHDPHTI